MTRREAADYIATLVEELKSIARPQDCPRLPIFLPKEEAQSERSRKPGPFRPSSVAS